MHSAARKLLSARQNEIATLVAAGKSSREIAETLFVSPRTVETHISSIFVKLGIRSRVELVASLFASDRRERDDADRDCDASDKLPRALTSFVGRETEMSAIATLLARNRLVTLTGIGGVGKTRTSVRVAAAEAARYPDGVYFVDLAPLTGGEYIAATTAQVLGLGLSVGSDPLHSLTRQLKSKHALVIFDNCEHVIDPVAKVIGTMLRECSKIAVLASSRQSLHIAGEATYLLPSLGASLAVDLFLERACAADDRFTVSDDDRHAIAEICRRLDGIPLAIELAAARVRVLRPRQLLERLSDRFRLLADGSRDVLPRHQTLRALIDWSHDLLDDRERALFRRVGVFVGGFTLEGATALGASAPLDREDVLETLASLIDKSLVLAEPSGDLLRYRLLESTRVYALEKLAAASETDAAARSHLRHLRDQFAELRQRAQQTGRTIDINCAFATELGDTRAALDSAIERDDVLVGGDLLADTGSLWMPLGLGREGRMRTEAYLAALPPNRPLLAARLENALAMMLLRDGRKLQALAVAHRAVEDARESDDCAALAETLRVLATTALSVGKLELAARALGEAEALPVVSTALRLALLRARAWLTMYYDPSAASPLYERLLEEYRSVGDPHGHLVTASNFAINECIRGNPERAIEITRDVLRARRSNADRWSLALSLSNFAGYLCAIDDLSGATEAALEGTALFYAVEPDSPNLAIAMEVLALVAARRGDLKRAATLEAFADATFRRHGFLREFATVLTYDRLQALLTAGLSPEHFARLTSEGAELSLDAAMALTEKDRVHVDRSTVA